MLAGCDVTVTIMQLEFARRSIGKSGTTYFQLKAGIAGAAN
jgi:hypothetical protein